MATIPVPIARVFISCPGDLRPQRGIVAEALQEVNDDSDFMGSIELVPYAYENIAPARAGMDAQEVVNSYVLRPEHADLFICMFWRRMGTPMTRFINPDTGHPYQSGTEYEFLTAYAAAQRAPTPTVLLYRCRSDAPMPTTDEERVQLARVDAFFERFGPTGDLKGLHTDFVDDASLACLIRRDAARVLRDNLMPLIERRAAAAQRAGPVFFGLPPLPASYVQRPAAAETLRKALLGSRPAVGIVAVTALQGLGGLGKSVLARAICDDPAVRAELPDGVLWATLGQHPDVRRLQREWIRSLGGDERADASHESGNTELTRLIGDRAFMLVLDDVWSSSDTAALLIAGPRCRTLITTRDAAQVEGAALVPLDLMAVEEARKVLRFASHERVTDVAALDAIAERLGYLPLALQVVGALLARDIPWAAIAHELDVGELPKIVAGQKSIFETLAASIHFLPGEHQQRYHELAAFPAAQPLIEAAVVRLWARSGYLSAFDAKMMLADFHDRSLIQANGALHDLQVDYLHAVVPEQERQRLRDLLWTRTSILPLA